MFRYAFLNASAVAEALRAAVDSSPALPAGSADAAAPAAPHLGGARV
ncbi:hypothetical protein [Actinacidiphila oryziradicis]|nr:hypothetical protein [Actinacidiphila oryziradicis]